MRAVVQRAHKAHVSVDGKVVGSISRGLVAFVGAERGDTDADLAYVVNKVAGLRVFSDDQGRMSRALADVKGQLLAISQFTLFGDVRRGLRPSFDDAMEPEAAEPMFNRFVEEVRARAIHVETGQFRAMMDVCVENDGPVTILIDSRKRF